MKRVIQINYEETKTRVQLETKGRSIKVVEPVGVWRDASL